MRRTFLVLLVIARTAVGDGDARALYEEGVREYDRAAYDRAIVLFEQAYAITHAPSLLYNIAQAYRQKGAGSCATARRYYERYLHERPAAPDRATIEGWISELQACAEAEATPAAQSNNTKHSTGDGAMVVKYRERSIVPPLALGAGAVLVASGLTLNRLAAARFNDLQHECPCTSSTWQSWRTADAIGWGLLAVGGLAAATGIVLWVRGVYVAPSGQGVVAGMALP